MTPKKATECKQASKGHTTLDIQMSPIKFVKTHPDSETERLSDQNGQHNN